MPTITRTVARDKDVAGIRRRYIGLYIGPASYATGGDSFTPQDVSLGAMEFIQFNAPNNVTPIIKFVVYDYTNNKVIWYDVAGTQTANATDLSGYSCRFEAVGK